MQQLGSEGHVLIGDLNAWESTAPTVCNQTPLGVGLDRLQPPGTHAWPRLHPSSEGFTGIASRSGCGVPEGYGWKRIDYAWSTPMIPVSMGRFGVVPGGDEAPSDHYGIIAEYPVPNESFPEPPSEPVTNRQPCPGDAVIHVADAIALAGGWRLVWDAKAASGSSLEDPDREVPKRTTPLAELSSYFDATFTAQAGRPIGSGFRQGGEELLDQRLGLRSVQPQHHPSGGAPVAHRNDQCHHGVDRAMQRLRPLGVGLGRQWLRQSKACWCTQPNRLADHSHPEPLKTG